MDLGTSGRLEPPGGGPGIFLEEASPETPLASGIYLGAGRSDLDPSPDVETVGEPISTHWGTQLRVVQDPDRREFFLQSPGG